MEPSVVTLTTLAGCATQILHDWKTSGLGSNCISPQWHADMSKVIGLLSELQRLKDLQLEHVDSELDSKRIVDLLLSNKIDMTEFGCVPSTCQDIVNSHFINSKI